MRKPLGRRQAGEHLFDLLVNRSACVGDRHSLPVGERLPARTKVETPQTGCQPHALGKISCGKDRIEERQYLTLEPQGLVEFADHRQVVDCPGELGQEAAGGMGFLLDQFNW